MSVLIRELGYVFQGTEGEEFNCIRSISGRDYPRFHLFIKQNNSGLDFNLHLDQKKPSYKGTSAHSGEYDGKLVEDEKERILKALEN